MIWFERMLSSMLCFKNHRCFCVLETRIYICVLAVAVCTLSIHTYMISPTAD